MAEDLRSSGFPIEIIDVASWDDKKKWKFYFNELLPLSVRLHKKLRGVVRTHKAGLIHLDCILISEDNFWTYEQACKKLRELLNKR